MKKILLLCVSVLGVVSLSGCDIVNMFTGNKTHTYSEFLALFKDSTAANKYSVATETDSSVSPSVKKDYVFDKENHEWVYTSTIDVDGTSFDITVKKHLEAYYFATELHEQYQDQIDENFYFYSSEKDKDYKIILKGSDDDNKFTVKFNEDGVMTSYEVKMKSNVLGTVTETLTYTYR